MCIIDFFFSSLRSSCYCCSSVIFFFFGMKRGPFVSHLRCYVFFPLFIGLFWLEDWRIVRLIVHRNALHLIVLFYWFVRVRAWCYSIRNASESSSAPEMMTTTDQKKKTITTIKMNNNNNRATGQLRANNWFSGNCKKNEIQQLRYPWEVISKIGILGVIIIEAERWARARSLQATTTQNEIKRKQHQQ